VNPGGLLLAAVIQLGIFLAPLVLSRAGLMSGEAAGLTAILAWFVVGMPLSYAVVDKVQRRNSLPASPEGTPARSVSSPSTVLYFP
jgi:hypothetical protein